MLAAGSDSSWNRVIGPALIAAFTSITVDLIVMREMELAQAVYPYLLVAIPAAFFVACLAAMLWRETATTRDAVIGATIGLYFGGLTYGLSANSEAVLAWMASHGGAGRDLVAAGPRPGDGAPEPTPVLPPAPPRQMILPPDLRR